MINQQTKILSWVKIKKVIDELGDYFFPSFSGNISVREGDLVFCTPTSIRKKLLNVEKISVVDLDNNLIDGNKQTSEINLHLEIYRNFEGVNCVVHTHPLFCCVFSCTKKKIELSLLPEYYLKIKKILYVKYITPGTKELGIEVVKIVKQELGNVKEAVVLMRNHGLVVFSDNVDRCIDLSFSSEEIAKINYLLKNFSKSQRIPTHLLPIIENLYKK